MFMTWIAALALQETQSVTREAFVQAVDKRFMTIDADGDGMLDTSELDAAQARIIERLQDRRRNVARANFAAADANGDGSVTLQEWESAALRAPLSVWTGSQLMRSLDTDRDGNVSLDEYRASQLRQFDDRDDDGDGTIGSGER